MKSSFFTSPTPYVIFFVTSRCNSRCRMCFYWRQIEDLEKKELTLDEIKKISEKFPPITYLTISGGESFLRDDLTEIVYEFVANNGVEFVSLPTNGILSERIAEMFEIMLLENPKTFFRIALSVDGVGDKHDEIRGVKCFESVNRTYEHLNALRENYSNFNIDVTTVYNQFNKNNIQEVFEWVDKNWVIDNHVLLLARGDTREKAAKDVSLDEYQRLAEWVEARESRKKSKGLKQRLLKAVKFRMRDIIYQSAAENRRIIPCLAGRKMVVVSETGEVYPCELLGQSLGQLADNDYDIKKILSSEKAQKVLKFIEDSGCHCTFECAIQNSIIYNPQEYLNVAKKLLKTT